VDGNQAVLAELGFAYLQNAAGQIHIGTIKAQCFPGAQSRACQQPNNGRQGLTPQPLFGR
jgi:hypothetical protein